MEVPNVDRTKKYSSFILFSWEGEGEDILKQNFYHF
jgi:hypothetical protein